MIILLYFVPLAFGCKGSNGVANPDTPNGDASRAVTAKAAPKAMPPPTRATNVRSLRELAAAIDKATTPVMWKVGGKVITLSIQFTPKGGLDEGLLSASYDGKSQHLISFRSALSLGVGLDYRVGVKLRKDGAAQFVHGSESTSGTKMIALLSWDSKAGKVNIAETWEGTGAGPKWVER